MSASLEKTSALPVDELALELEFEGAEPDAMVAEVHLDDDVTSYTTIERDEEGTWRLLVPPHPSGIDGGELTLTVIGDGFRCEPQLELTIEPMEPAPGTTQKVVDNNIRVIELQAQALGLTVDELRVDDLDSLPVHLWGAAIALEGFDGESNSASLTKIMDGSSPDFALDEESMAFVDALFARLAYVEAQEEFIARLEELGPPPETPTFTMTSAYSTRQQALDGCSDKELRVHVGNDARQLHQYMNMAQFSHEWANSDALDFGSKMVAHMGLSKNPVAKFGSLYVGAAIFYDKVAHLSMAHTLPSRITDSEVDIDTPEFPEDATNPGRWDNFRIWVASKGWDVTPQMFEVLMMAYDAASTGVGVIDEMINGASGNILSDYAKMQAKNALLALLQEIEAEGNPCNVPPFHWGPVDVSDTPWSQVEYRAAIQGVQGDRWAYQPATTGKGLVIVKIRDNTFPPAENRASSLTSAEVTVHEIRVQLDPAVGSVEPGETLRIAALVSNAEDTRVEWEIIGGGGSIAEDGIDGAGNDVAVLTAPTDESQFPITVMAYSIANTGIRNGKIHSDPRDAFGIYRAIGEVQIEPSSACVWKNELAGFRAELAGIEGDVTWSANGGQIDQNGVFKSSRKGEFTVTATSTRDPSKSDKAYVRVGDCSCYFQATLGPPLNLTITDYDSAGGAWMFGTFGVNGTDPAGNSMAITALHTAPDPGLHTFDAGALAVLAGRKHVYLEDVMTREFGQVSVTDLGDSYIEGTFHGTGIIPILSSNNHEINIPMTARFRVFWDKGESKLFDGNGKCVD